MAKSSCTCYYIHLGKRIESRKENFLSPKITLIKNGYMNSLKKDGEKKKSSMMSIPLTGERNLKWYLNLFYLQSTHHISVNEWVD